MTARPKTDWLQGLKFTTEELVEMVKNHAVRMYEFDGWDFLVECCEDEEIKEAIGGAKSFAGACENAARGLGLKLKAEYRSEVVATEW
jgi:hypothetical protein